MTWIAIVIGIIILIPIAIWLIRRWLGFLAWCFVGIAALCLFSKNYIGAAVMLVIAIIMFKLAPEIDPDDADI